MGRRVVRQNVAFDDDSVSWRFTPSGGPGGQHANRAATRVSARLRVADVEAPPEVRDRLRAALGDEVEVVVDEHRSQHRNRDVALDRLADRLRAALVRRPTRRATRPTRSSQRRRVEAKRRRAETKASRRRPSRGDW